MVQCEPSIKSIIVNIDSSNHDFIVEDLDEERLVIKENMMATLKQRLKEVSLTIFRRLVVTCCCPWLYGGVLQLTCSSAWPRCKRSRLGI